jgi:hypothetical protein
MASSFPYFALSRRLGIPYAQVLDKVRQLDEPEPAADSRRPRWVPLTPAMCDAIYEVWCDEIKRRKDVNGCHGSGGGSGRRAVK